MQAAPINGDVKISCGEDAPMRFDWTTRELKHLPPSARLAGTWVLTFKNGRFLRAPADVQTSDTGRVRPTPPTGASCRDWSSSPPDAAPLSG